MNDDNQQDCPLISENEYRHIFEQRVEVDDAFSFSGYQVVRNEFFSHMHEPTITFNRSRFYVNKACISRLPDVSHIQVLINPVNRCLVIRPSSESERGAFMWYTDGKKGRCAKQVTCRIFYALVMKMMEWNPEHRYKLLGKLISSKNEYLFVFDLTSPAIYQRVQFDPETGNHLEKTEKKPTYPRDWEGKFGLPLDENQKSLQINIFDGYAVYGLVNKAPMLQRSTENMTVERSEAP